MGGYQDLMGVFNQLTDAKACITDPEYQHFDIFEIVELEGDKITKVLTKNGNEDWIASTY